MGIQNLKKSTLFVYLDALEKDIITEEQFCTLAEIGSFETHSGKVFGEALVSLLSKVELSDRNEIFHHFISMDYTSLDSGPTLFLENEFLIHDKEKRTRLFLKGKTSDRISSLASIYSDDEIWNDKELLSWFENSLEGEFQEVIKCYVVGQVLCLFKHPFFQNGKHRDILKKLLSFHNTQAVPLFFNIVQLKSVVNDRKLQEHFVFLLQNFEYTMELNVHGFGQALCILEGANKLSKIREKLLQLNTRDLDIDKNSSRFSYGHVLCLANQLKYPIFSSNEAFEKLLSYDTIADIEVASLLLRYHVKKDVYNAIMNMKDRELRDEFAFLSKYPKLMDSALFVEELSQIKDKRKREEKLEVKAYLKNDSLYLKERDKEFEKRENAPYFMTTYLHENKNLSKEELVSMKKILNGNREDSFLWSLSIQKKNKVKQKKIGEMDA